jgi:ribosomal protein L37AE/L43A
MGQRRRAAVVLSAAAFIAGWVYRQAFPKVICPRCGSNAWRRVGGGIKQCRACSWKFFAQLPAPKNPNGPAR